jgi:hypothetical protein
LPQAESLALTHVGDPIITRTAGAEVVTIKYHRRRSIRVALRVEGMHAAEGRVL